MCTICYTGTIDPFPYRTSRNTIIPLNIFVCTFFRLYHIIKDHDLLKTIFRFPTRAVAAVLAGILFTPSLRYMNTDVPATSNRLAIENNNVAADPVDKWIKELSDEELEEIVSFSENDIFLN